MTARSKRLSKLEERLGRSRHSDPESAAMEAIERVQRGLTVDEMIRLRGMHSTQPLQEVLRQPEAQAIIAAAKTRLQPQA